MPSKQVYSLYQLSQSIKKLLGTHANQAYWVKAELLKLNHYAQTGHCYPDLVEKQDNRIKAQFRANIWKTNYQIISKKFEEIGEKLKDDMTIVAQVKVNYHEVYGLSLNIIDIDVNYTLGELARSKQDAINRLKKEQLFNLNKSTQLALLPKTIAVISVETSKGYSDFIDIIENNPQQFKFHIKLFPAILQGDKAAKTIIQQLRLIEDHKQLFDAVCIIRGGGGEIGLSAYDDYDLSKHIAKFPIPVLTGIGHSTNLTVSELVSHENFITPTKLAEFLIDKYNHFSQNLDQYVVSLNKTAAYMLNKQKDQLKSLNRLFQIHSKNKLETSQTLLDQSKLDLIKAVQVNLRNQHQDLAYFNHSIKAETKDFIKSEQQAIKHFINQLKQQAQQSIRTEYQELKLLQTGIQRSSQLQLKAEQQNLSFIQQQLKLLNPNSTLQRGFSITKINSKTLVSAAQLKKGDTIITSFYKGEVESTLTKIIKK